MPVLWSVMRATWESSSYVLPSINKGFFPLGLKLLNFEVHAYSHKYNVSLGLKLSNSEVHDRAYVNIGSQTSTACINF